MELSSSTVQAGPEYINGIIPTALIAGELESVGANTFAAEAWREQVADAAQLNSGLVNSSLVNSGFGNVEQGFLAWSKLGFVRLRNANLTARQNLRLAKLSLQLGLPVENLPSRTETQFNEGQQRWIEGFLANAEKQLQAFREKRSDSIDLRDGKLRFGLKLDEQLQLPLNYYYKKRSGLKRLGRRFSREWGEISKSVSGRRALRALAKRSSTVQQLINDTPYRAAIEADPLYQAGAAADAYGQGKITSREFSKRYANSYATVASLTPSPTALTAVLKSVQLFAAKSVAEGKLQLSEAIRILLSLQNVR